VYSGQTGTLLYTFTGEAAFDQFGRSVSGAGDVNNDGFADLIVGAFQNDSGGTDAGGAFVYSCVTCAGAANCMESLTQCASDYSQCSDDLAQTTNHDVGDVNCDGAVNVLDVVYVVNVAFRGADQVKGLCDPLPEF
jgi:hypothetical protein